MSSGHSIKTDNFSISSKVYLRQEATKDIAEKKVLDLFAGENKLWSYFDCKKYYGIEKVKNKGKNVWCDNLRIIPSLDLSQFNIIDCDSYGIPVNQIDLIYKNPTLEKGTIIIYTFIYNKMTTIPTCLQEHIGIRGIYKKNPTAFNQYTDEYFDSYLKSKNVDFVYEYSVEGSSFKKRYGFFRV